MLKKVASTKLLSGLFVAGGILGMNQAAKAGNVVNSEVIKPVISYSRSYAVFASKPLQADAAFLIDATVVAAGGYHMSIAALNVFQSCLLPNSIP